MIVLANIRLGCKGIEKTNANQFLRGINFKEKGFITLTSTVNVENPFYFQVMIWCSKIGWSLSLANPLKQDFYL